MIILCTYTQQSQVKMDLDQGIGTGLADPAAAGPKFPVLIIASTIKINNYQLLIIRQIRQRCTSQIYPKQVIQVSEHLEEAAQNTVISTPQCPITHHQCGMQLHFALKCGVVYLTLHSYNHTFIWVISIPTVPYSGYAHFATLVMKQARINYIVVLHIHNYIRTLGLTSQQCGK